MTTMAQTRRNRGEGRRAARDLAGELRDGLLQDLLAVGMLAAILRRQLGGEHTAPAGPLLDHIAATLDGDLAHLRAMIAELNAA